MKGVSDALSNIANPENVEHNTKMEDGSTFEDSD